uniref:Uncharacterized protein n=1 Tax=Romanomermis culicivorax TaxID=13658 RepID=A0A915L4J8_ROMCU
MHPNREIQFGHLVQSATGLQRPHSKAMATAALTYQSAPRTYTNRHCVTNEQPRKDRAHKSNHKKFTTFCNFTSRSPQDHTPYTCYAFCDTTVEQIGEFGDICCPKNCRSLLFSMLLYYHYPKKVIDKQNDRELFCYLAIILSLGSTCLLQPDPCKFNKDYRESKDIGFHQSHSKGVLNKQLSAAGPPTNIKARSFTASCTYTLPKISHRSFSLFFFLRCLCFLTFAKSSSPSSSFTIVVCDSERSFSVDKQRFGIRRINFGFKGSGVGADGKGSLLTIVNLRGLISGGEYAADFDGAKLTGFAVSVSIITRVQTKGCGNETFGQKFEEDSATPAPGKFLIQTSFTI